MATVRQKERRAERCEAKKERNLIFRERLREYRRMKLKDLLWVYASLRRPRDRREVEFDEQALRAAQMVFKDYKVDPDTLLAAAKTQHPKIFGRIR